MQCPVTEDTNICRQESIIFQSSGNGLMKHHCVLKMQLLRHDHPGKEHHAR